MSTFFSYTFTVTTHDIDDLNHVNNAVYVQWMDEVALKHWAFLTENHPFENYIWVVVRHEIDYKGEAVLGDVIKAKTWVGDTKGFTSVRYIEFYKNDVLITKAKTTWAMLDAKTYKPARIKEDVLKILQVKK